MKNRSSWRGTLVVVFAIGAGWIGYMGWPLYGLITLAAEQSNSPNRPQAGAVVQDPNCPGNDNHALMCRLVNEYRAKHCSGSTGGGAGFILRKWIDSSGHRENMLTPEWKTIGGGVTATFG